MGTARQPDPSHKKQTPEHPHNGATEDQVDMKDTVPQRLDKKGSKAEDIAGTGEHDSSGG